MTEFSGCACTGLPITAMGVACLGIQEDDPLLGDEEIYACALVSSPLFDFLRLGSEHITPEQAMK